MKKKVTEATRATIAKYLHKDTIPVSEHRRPSEIFPDHNLEAMLDETTIAANPVPRDSIYPVHVASSFFNDDDIYKHRFTKGLFLLAQLCAAWVVFLFDVLYYYFELHWEAIELSEAGFPKSEHSRMVIYGTLGTVGIMSLWFLLGMAFSRLFTPTDSTRRPVYPGT